MQTDGIVITFMKSGGQQHLTFSKEYTTRAYLGDGWYWYLKCDKRQMLGFALSLDEAEEKAFKQAKEFDGKIIHTRYNPPKEVIVADGKIKDAFLVDQELPFEEEL
jgi:hypothetical protein